jgi:hypothetical protein
LGVGCAAGGRTPPRAPPRSCAPPRARRRAPPPPPPPPPPYPLTFSLFGVLTIPDIAREAADFINRLKSDNVWVSHPGDARVTRG